MPKIREGLSYDDVMLVPKRSPVQDLNDVDLSSELVPGLKLDVPLLGAPMDTVTEAEMAKALSREGALGVIHRFLNPKEQAAEVRNVKQAGERVGATIGINEDVSQRTEQLLDAGVDVIMIDIAHGHLDPCLDTVRRLRREFGDIPLVAGNIATAEAVDDFAAAGVDCVKIGIGPGSHCTTRKVTGAGVPQMTAVLECAQAAREYGITSIADGGIRESGEIVKALMAGSDAAMLGGLLMGTDETPGEVVMRNGEKYKKSRGMASNEARQERTDKEDDNYAAEGVEGLTPYKGPVQNIVSELAAGMRSGISYCGAHTVGAARENAEFVKTSYGAKTREGVHGHGIQER